MAGADRKLEQFDVSAIEVHGRLRTMKEAGVEAVAASLASIGLRTPIAVSGSNGFSIIANAAAVTQVDDVILYEATATSLPQGDNYFWLQPVNDGIGGPVSGPFIVTII